jgi:hypothetical protein
MSRHGEAWKRSATCSSGQHHACLGRRLRSRRDVEPCRCSCHVDVEQPASPGVDEPRQPPGRSFTTLELMPDKAV